MMYYISLFGWLPVKYTVKPPKEDKPNKGQALDHVHTLIENNLSTKDKVAGPESLLIKRFHCTQY